jgi:cell division protein ZapA (FtsZ GTPase activity inhibitor)
MTEIRQEFEIEILGCRVKYKPTQEDCEVARLAADLILKQIQDLKFQKPGLKDTDLAVLIALKVMTEKLQFEKDCREMMDKTEASLKNILDQVQI